MLDTLLTEFTNVFQSLPFDVFEKDILRDFWINGFSDLDDQVRSHFFKFREHHVFVELPTLLERACRATEKLLKHYGEETTNESEKDNQHSYDSVNTEDTASTTDSTFSKTKGSGPWASLAKSNIGQQSVLSLLFVFLQSECSSDISVSDKKLCLLSARLYMDLLCLPGRVAFGVFQDSIFQNAISCLRIKDSGQTNGSKKSKKSGRAGGKKKGRRVSEESDDDDNDDELGNEENDQRQSFQDVSNISVDDQRKLILKVLIALQNVLESVALKRHLGLVIEKLFDICTWEPELVPPITDLAENKRGLQIQQDSISTQAYKDMIALCNAVHGDMHKIFCNIFVRLLPHIIMSGTGSSQNIPRHILLIKDKATEFVSFLIRKFSPAVLPSARILIQHASTKVADRAEFRFRVSQSLIAFTNGFPVTERALMVEWFHRLSNNPKPSHRVFALELLYCLLTEPEFCDPNVTPEQAAVLSYESLLKAVVERIDDVSPMASSRAMSLLSGNKNLVNRLLDQPNNRIDLKSLTELLLESCNSEKSTIRKAALQLLEILVCQSEDFLTNKNLQMICDHSQDVNVSVQKQASMSIKKVLETYPSVSLAQDMWLEAQLPLVYADELTVQEKGMEAMEEVFLHELLQDSDLAWIMLHNISEGKHQDKQQNLRRAFSIWLREKKGRPQDFLRVVKRRMDGCYRGTAWMVLVFLTLNHKINDSNFVLDACFEELNKELETVGTVVLQRMLQVVCQIAEHADKDRLTILLQELQTKCQLFHLPSPILSTVFQTFDTMFNVIFVKNPDEEKNRWCNVMNQEIDNIFTNSSILEQGFNESNSVEEEKLIRCIFTVGEVFQLCPRLLPPKFKLVIHSLIGRPTISPEMFLPNDMPFSSPPQPGSVTPRIKSHAVISFGKLCIGDREFCKSSLLTAVKELKESPEPCIRNNLSLALSDLLIYHPNLIDPYISNITACLCDETEPVRRQTLMALAKLLKEDFMKWKGTLFYRVLLCYVDESVEVKKMAEYCLLHLLLKRQPQAFSHHFVECIYFYNSYTKYTSFNQFPNEKEYNIIHFTLKDSSEKRFKIYKFLLCHMTDEERFGLYSQLTQDVFVPLLDGALTLDQDLNDIIRDTLHILCSEEIKFSASAETHEEEDEEKAAICAAAKKTISKLLRKEMAVAMVPIIVSLKTFLENAKSPLIKDLEMFLAKFLKDFKNELENILGEEKQLASEIRRILKNSEETENTQ